jgi:hypothetical protein
MEKRRYRVQITAHQYYVFEEHDSKQDAEESGLLIFKNDVKNGSSLVHWEVETFEVDEDGNQV